MYLFPHLCEEEALANGGNSGNGIGGNPTSTKGGADSTTSRTGTNKQSSSGGNSSGNVGRQTKPIKGNQYNDETKTNKKSTAATVAYMVVSNPLSSNP